MSYIDQVYAILIYVWSEIQSKAPVMGFIIACTVSSLQMVLSRNFKVAEMLLCGVLAAIACTGGEFLAHIVTLVTGLVIPADVVGGFVAGAIGFAGSKSTMLFIKNRFVKENPK